MAASTLSLSNLLRIAFTEPVAWLCGEKYIHAQVNWVALSTEKLQAGDILVIDAGEWNTALLLEAGQHEAAAILFVNYQTQEDIPTSSDLPILAAPAGVDQRTAERVLITALINQRAALIERGMRIHTQLSQLETEGAGLGGLVKTMANITGHGALVQDKRLVVLAATPSTALTNIWNNIIQPLQQADSIPEALRDRKAAGKQVSLINQELPGGLERLIIPIIVGEVVRGYLSLIASTGEMDALDQLVAEQGASVCAAEMSRNKAVREAEKRLKADLLNALLHENITPRDARLWTQSMELDTTQMHVALRFAWEGAEPPSRRRLETLINGEIAQQGLKTIVNPMGIEIVCFCQVPPANARPEKAISLGAAVLEQARREYPKQLALCGVGLPARDLNAWRISFRQAGQALEMARRLRENNPLYFPDLSVYRLLMQIEHNPELFAFKKEILGPLLDHEGGGELIHTLQAYFEHNGNLSQTAEALFIHRNTLIYRLERIANLTNLNWDEPETRLAVQLALHIFRMTGSKSN